MLWSSNSVNSYRDYTLIINYTLHSVIIFTYNCNLRTLTTTFAVGLCSHWDGGGRDLAVQNHVMKTMMMMKVTSADG